jgi:hypothetical protein
LRLLSAVSLPLLDLSLSWGEESSLPWVDY